MAGLLLEAEADLEADLVVRDRALLDVAADLGHLEPVQAARRSKPVTPPSLRLVDRRQRPVRYEAAEQGASLRRQADRRGLFDLPSPPHRGRPPGPTSRRGLPRLSPRLRLPSRARGRPPGVRPPPRNRRGRVLHLLFMGGVSRRPERDQPHRARVRQAAALQLFSASWLTTGSARTCPVGNSCYWLGSGTASRSSCRGCPVDRPG